MNSNRSLFENERDASNIPTHIAIIMDGNGRWARKRFLSRIKGHEKGAETVRMIVRTCREIGVSMLTLFAFSTENWQRPRTEINALMHLLKRFLNSELNEMMQNGVRLKAIGQTERLPNDVRSVLEHDMRMTAQNRGMQLNLALSYGARAEIIRMVQQVAADVKDGVLSPDAISDETIQSRLYTADMPDPDLLIRTSGEMRISNFLLWQIAYAELAVTRTLWPDFTQEEFIAILKDYQSRKRRFGRIET